IESAEATTVQTRRILQVLGVVSLLAALVISWFYIGRHLLKRLDALSARMRSMARGDLETPISVTGRDEIADMGAALEIFRSHALEVQRLNLVEELANEIQEKNTALEKVLEDLQSAQDQIVMREKLAALGELTAGVAHEIKNPLNFVKNFSESSEELLEELNEAVEMTDESREEQMEEIKSIAEILVDNLGRIRHHATRADRIVHDMLSMGRDEAHAQKVQLNRIVEENAKLAFHGARAQDQDVQLKINNDLDPEIGEVYIVPQDIGRVILNIVGNACYETNKKLAALRESEGENAIRSYMPQVDIKTVMMDDMAQISIRDNGDGIPEDVISKIFNPFFTTKPTDKGTGLGLSMSSDIIREHGGRISVTSNPGEYTEMVIELPLDARLSLGGKDDGDTGDEVD
ncbi:MAG: ATP-binding protein, partial [Rhodobacteraceae bacterium]|nr:ATP-binding protein [Paracoccaceae bacterium]